MSESSKCDYCGRSHATLFRWVVEKEEDTAEVRRLCPVCTEHVLRYIDWRRWERECR